MPKRVTPRSSPRGQEPQVPVKKMTPEEIAKSADRLNRPRPPTRELPPLVVSRVLSKDEEEHFVERVYTQSIKARERNHEHLTEKVLAKGVHPEDKKMDSQDVSSLVERLYEKSIVSKQHAMDKLMSTAPSSRESKPRLSSAQQLSINERLFRASVEKQRSSKGKLFEMYVVKRLPQCAKMRPSEISETADRLSKKKG